MKVNFAAEWGGDAEEDWRFGGGEERKIRFALTQIFRS